MGTQGKKIIDLDLTLLIEELNKAFADEWLAYYQYWLGAQIIEGPLSGPIRTELLEHAAQELNHAQMLSERILQLGGSPLSSPQKWYEKTNCGYEDPTDPNSLKLLKQNIKGEQCAIIQYKKLLDLTFQKDPITYEMLLLILKEEIEHEEDLETLEREIENYRSL